MRLIEALRRWKFLLLTFKDYADRLNRCVEVENTLLSCSAGKRDILTREECLKLAQKLGVPQCFRNKAP